MKHFFIFILVLIFNLSPMAFSCTSDNDDSNWGTAKTQLQQSQAGEAEEEVWSNERDTYIYENYGTDYSSSFLNRSNIDTYEADHGGDAFDLSN